MIIAIVGCGVMGNALARFFSKQHSLLLCDIDKEKAESLAQETGGKYYERVNDAIQDANAVVLAVKPDDLSSVSRNTGAAFSDGQLLISSMAATSAAMLKKHFPIAHIERIMPSLAISHGAGIVAIAEEEHTLNEKKWMEKLLHGLGHLYWCSEARLEILTTLTGSLPAFFCLLVEAMIESGVYLGVPAKVSKQLILKTIEGTLALLNEPSAHPALIKESIASPGSMTIEGLKSLEESGVRSGLYKAFIASHRKGTEILDKKR